MKITRFVLAAAVAASAAACSSDVTAPDLHTLPAAVYDLAEPPPPDEDDEEEADPFTTQQTGLVGSSGGR